MTVCVVDELPFTNVAGSQHPKRYLEVHDLLLAGINVITAMNIQHLESLHDTVLRATGVDVRERVPDRFVLEADHVVNVDLTAEELRERLRLGKIYPADRAAAALENFFTENNLNELRELALRETANVLDQRPRAGTKSPTDVSEKIAVCISTNPVTTARLLRGGDGVAFKDRTAAAIPDAATARARVFALLAPPAFRACALRPPQQRTPARARSALARRGSPAPRSARRARSAPAGAGA